MRGRHDISGFLIISVFLMSCLSLVASSAKACTVSFPTVRVPSTFRVTVNHGSTPISGIKVEVYDQGELYRGAPSSGWKPILTLVTSRDGSAEVKNLPNGHYLLQTTGPGAGSAVEAEISEKAGQLTHEVSLEWPYSRDGILKTRLLSGQLLSNDPWMPFKNVRAELWAAGQRRPLAVQDTGPEGRFSFEETRPGIYVLRIHGHQDISYDQIEGDLAVELAPSSPDAFASLNLRLATTTCGIEYSRCSANEAAIAGSTRRIRVIYEPGVSEYPGVENAKYRLFDENGALIAEGTTDHDGVANLPSDFRGKSTLVVASSLSATVQQSLNLLAPDEHAPDLVVTMKTILGIHSACSTVALETNATQK